MRDGTHLPLSELKEARCERLCTGPGYEQDTVTATHAPALGAPPPKRERTQLLSSSSLAGISSSLQEKKDKKLRSQCSLFKDDFKLQASDQRPPLQFKRREGTEDQVKVEMGARSEQGSDQRPRRNCQHRKNVSLLCSALGATRDTGLWAMWSRAHTSAAGPAQPEAVKTLGCTNSQEEEHPVFLPKGESLDGLHTRLPWSRGRRAVGLQVLSAQGTVHVGCHLLGIWGKRGSRGQLTERVKVL